MAQDLWTPDRNIPLNVQGRESCSPDEMRVIRAMHEIAQRRSIELRCTRCGAPFHGLNDGQARDQAVFCKCREIKAEVGGRVIQSAFR